MTQTPDMAPKRGDESSSPLITTAEILTGMLTGLIVPANLENIQGHGHRFELNDDEDPLNIFHPNSKADN